MHRWSLRPGDSIAEDLRVVRPLGGGPRYEDQLAWHEGLRALVVVKRVRPRRLTDVSAVEGLHREAEALRAFAHPALPRLFGVALDAAHPYLVLEFIEGARLSALIARGRLRPDRVLGIALGLCGVLHYLAGEGVVHQGVAPRNVLAGNDPRLLDLSGARRADGEPVPATAPGVYRAPEQCDRWLAGQIGPASDIWSLGVVLHEALAGHLPFPDDGAPFPQLRGAPLQLPGDVPGSIAAVVRACLAERPADRPAAGELAAVLEPLVDTLPGPFLGRFRSSHPTIRR